MLVITSGENAHHPPISKPKAGLLRLQCAYELLGDLVKMQILNRISSKFTSGAGAPDLQVAGA